MMQNSYGAYSNYRCVACNVFFSNFDEQKQHYFTYHSRSVDQGNLAAPMYSQYRQLTSTSKKGFLVKCDVCNVSCSSQTAYEFHMKGKKHTKSLNKIALSSDESKNNSGIITNENKVKSLPASTVPVTIQQSQILYNPNLTCEACQVSCSKLDQLQKHLEGGRHQKKMKLNKFIELKIKKDPSVYCDICDLYMMEESMKLHKTSGKHKRKSTDKTTDEPAAKKSKSADIPTTVENCGYCRISFKNPTDAVTHYQTQKHSLNMINRSKNYELWCDVCQISFANENFLNLHLKGFRHYVRVNRGNVAPVGEFSERLIKMREKMKGLKTTNKIKKFSYAEKYKFVPNEPLVKPNSESEDVAESLVADSSLEKENVESKTTDSSLGTENGESKTTDSSLGTENGESQPADPST